MAEDDKEKGAEKDEAVAVAESKDDDSDDLGDALMDLFTIEEEVDPALGALVATLDDVEIYDLLEQVREIQSIMDERRGS